jgi:putative Mg2+ transporter-C (MgtC) family protein
MPTADGKGPLPIHAPAAAMRPGTGTVTAPFACRHASAREKDDGNRGLGGGRHRAAAWGAVAAGILIGLNRDLQSKPIGLRTLGLVSLGAAAVTVATIQVPGITENPDGMNRVAQGVIQGIRAGIRFIGADVILHDRDAKSVHGLTIAATVWVTAGLGIACGLAAWTTVAVALALALLLLVGLGKLEAWLWGD